MLREGADVPDKVFRIVLPLFWLWLIIWVAANRQRVLRDLGRDPIVIRPWQKSETAEGYLDKLLTAGFFLAAVAVRQMGVSWRIGVDNRAPGPLVSRGVFSRVRHPIYAGMLLAAAGVAGVTADLLSVAVAAAACVGLPLQARLEEAFLLSRYSQQYRSYLERTGRFWPKIL